MRVYSSEPDYISLRPKETYEENDINSRAFFVAPVGIRPAAADGQIFNGGKACTCGSTACGAGGASPGTCPSASGCAMSDLRGAHAQA